MVYQFIAHKTPGKGRIFALVKSPEERLEAVTTLAAGDVHLVDDLVDGLNTFLYERKEGELNAILAEAPDAVSMAVRRFIRDHCSHDLGEFSEYGPIDTITQFVFTGLDAEFEEVFDAATTIGLGTRLENYLAKDGVPHWWLTLRSDQAYVPIGNELRTWTLPEAVRVASTWTSVGAQGSQTDALHLAVKASDEGRRVRVHSLWRVTHGTPARGGATTEFVVDVFDAPIPVRDE